MRDVVIAGNGEHRTSELPQEGGRTLLLIGPPAVRQVAAGNHQLGSLAVDQPGQGLDEIGHMDEKRGHRSGRL